MRLFRRRPLDWTRGAGRPPAARPRSVDVIIPVYGAAEELRACLASVERWTDLTRHRVTLVLDGPDSGGQTILSGREGQTGLSVLHNPVRRGFVGAANRGMRETSGDVVLLNSDTIVTEGWLEKLIDAAYSSGDAGTVTPLSNNATLCSVPRPFEENELPPGFDVDSYAAHVERVSRREYVRLPTGVGVCFYIRRALLDDIGFFDEEHFGLGYGEENDFCMRALARGWLHVADDATFIWHEGHRSFGETDTAPQRRALQKKHPRYMATIAEFMKLDPLRVVRTRIARRVVHLVHGWPPAQTAGTELYAYWLAQQQRASGSHVAVYARTAGETTEVNDKGLRVRLVKNDFTTRDPFRRNALRDRAMERDFERFLREERPDVVHIHHLAGHAFSLARVAKRLGIPIVQQIQDWWFLCARVNRFDRDGKRCTGPAPAKCAACVTLSRVVPNGLMHAARRVAAQRALRAADAYVAGSNAIREDYRHAVDASKPFFVLPYGVDIVPARAPASTGQRLRFGYVGSISPHKGVHVAVEAIRGLDATLHVWGDAGAYPGYVATLQAPNVIFEGRFAEEDKPRVFAAMDVLLVPSIGLESFGLAAREAMTCGVPVIATEGGALSELEGAELVPAGDAAALRAILQRVIDEPALVAQWAARITPPKRTDVHAGEIERVYEQVLR